MFCVPGKRRLESPPVELSFGTSETTKGPMMKSPGPPGFSRATAAGGRGGSTQDSITDQCRAHAIDVGRLREFSSPGHDKAPPRRGLVSRVNPSGDLALTGFEARVGLVDDVNLAATTDDLAVLVSLLGRLERRQNFHGRPFSLIRSVPHKA